MAPRVLAIGDVHGCHLALERLLAELAPGPDDTVVFLGDLVDRGPGTRQVLEQVLALQSRCGVVLIRGNHEDMLLNGLHGGEWLDTWLRYGGQAALDSYGGDPANIPSAHVELLESAFGYWQSDSDVFVHANLAPGVSLDKQHPYPLRWTHLTGTEEPFAPDLRVICGHTPQRTGVPLCRPGWVCIDTFACGGAWLTALQTDTGQLFQASQTGAFRSGQLGHPMVK